MSIYICYVCIAENSSGVQNLCLKWQIGGSEIWDNRQMMSQCLSYLENLNL